MRFSQEALASGPEVIGVHGGDGTVNEAAMQPLEVSGQAQLLVAAHWPCRPATRRVG